MTASPQQNYPKPIIALAGFSGSGKTTLLCQLLEILTARGLKIAVVKHTHHALELDKPGKDSYQLRQSGAYSLTLSCPNQVIYFGPQISHDDLDAQLAQLNWPAIDAVIVEGYRHSQVEKLEVHRPSLGKPRLCDSDSAIIAIASDVTELPVSIACWPLNQPEVIAEKLLEHWQLTGFCG